MNKIYMASRSLPCGIIIRMIFLFIAGYVKGDTPFNRSISQ